MAAAKLQRWINMVPHPYSSSRFEAGHAGVVSAAVQRQLEMRAQILACARKLLAERGIDSFSVRKVADKSNVTAQTVYNCFGPKRDLLFSAISDYISMIFSDEKLQASSPTVLMDLSDSYFLAAHLVPDFMRQMLSVLYASQDALVTQMQIFSRGLRNEIIGRMLADGFLRDCADATALGDAICRNNTLALFDWSFGNVQLVEARRQALSMNALILAKALRLELATGVDEWEALFLDRPALQKPSAGAVSPMATCLRSAHVDL